MPADSKKKADILISFKEGKHRCVRSPCVMTEPFPETNHVLAHTFNPEGGKIKDIVTVMKWIHIVFSICIEHTLSLQLG